MGARSTRGVLIGLMMVALVVAAAGGNFAASVDSGGSTQWTVGGDGRFPGDADDYAVGTLDLPNVEPVIVGDVADLPPAGERQAGN